MLTVDDRFSVVAAVAVGERIMACNVVDINELAGPQTRKVDLEGRTVIQA